MIRDLLILLSLFFAAAIPGPAFAQTDTGGTDAALQQNLEAMPQQNREAMPQQLTSKNQTSLRKGSPQKPARSADWNMEFASEYEGENKDEALAVMTGLGLDMRFNFAEALQLKVEPIARFYSARSQSRFDADNFEDRITLYEGYLRYAPHSMIAGSVGTHAQNFIDQTQLISNTRSFPGLMLQFMPFTDQQKPILSYEEAVPTSYTYNALREDKEPLPGLRILDATLKSEWSKDLSTKIQIGRLSWRNLPTKTAFNSGSLGNTITGDLAPGTQFAYQFNTTYAQASATFCEMCRFGVFATFKRSSNSEAPSDAADAQLMGVGVSMRTLKTYTRVSLSDFFSESDVTPGQYASSSMGNNNRQGMSVNADLEIPALNLKIKSQLIQARPINPDPYQFDMTTFYLGVETDGHFL